MKLSLPYTGWLISSEPCIEHSFVGVVNIHFPTESPFNSAGVKLFSCFSNKSSTITMMSSSEVRVYGGKSGEYGGCWTHSKPQLLWQLMWILKEYHHIMCEAQNLSLNYHTTDSCRKWLNWCNTEADLGFSYDALWQQTTHPELDNGSFFLLI